MLLLFWDVNGEKVLFRLIVTFFQAKVGQRHDCFAKVTKVQTPEGVICLTLTGAADRRRLTPSVHAPEETSDCPKITELPHHAGETSRLHFEYGIKAYT